MTEVEQLRQAMAALEAQRPLLGDAVVDTALQPMREKLERLESPAPRSELKYITVMFADVVGSTKLAEHMDPEEVLELTDGAMQRFNRVVAQHGGRITRFMGDGFKAVFGVPKAREDDAERAVKAGLALLAESQDYAKSLSRQRGIPAFQIRVGIHTGQVVHGGGLEEDNSFMGTTINLAARMESSAPPGGLRISHDTYRHVRGIFDVQPQPPIQVKGRDEPMQTYLVLAAKPRAFRTLTRGVQGVETRMIGRQAELQTLQAGYRGVVVQRQAGAVILVGEAGVGKSRLLYELTEWLELQPERITYFKGRATLQSSSLPYGLLQDMLAGRFEIYDNDPLEMVRRKLEQGASTFLDEDPARLAHLFGALLGFDLAGSPFLAGIQDNARLLHDLGLEALGRLFAAAAARQPVVLFLEDIHWADPASLDAALALLAANASLPLFLVCVARPSFFESFPEWLPRLQAAGIPTRRIDLQPLDEGLSRQLLAEILKKAGNVPDALAGLLVSASDGNPYFLEELVNILIDQGVIVKDEQHDRWEIEAGRLHGLQVPPTMTALLQARFDRLTPTEKTALQQASVAGRIFWDRLLQEMQETHTLPEAELHHLEQRELVLRRPESAFAETQEFIFKHAMLRDVVYESVLKRDRARYHARVAAWLEAARQASGRAGELAATIADHYALAGENRHAAEWYLHAGRRAQKQGAVQEARRFFDRTLELSPGSEDELRWQALLGRNEALFLLGDIEARRRDDAELLEMAQSNPGRLGQAHYHIAFAFAATGNERLAADHYRLAIQAAQQAADRQLEALNVAMLVIACIRTGERTAASEYTERALRLVEAGLDEETTARVLTNLSVYFTETGDLGRAARLLEQQAGLNRRVENLSGEAVSLSNLGFSYVQMGLYEQGRDVLQQSLEVSKRASARRQTAYCYLNLGLACLRCGEVERARQEIGSSMQVLAGVQDRFGLAAGELYLGLLEEMCCAGLGSRQHYAAAHQAFIALEAWGYAADAQAGLLRCDLAGELLEGVQASVAALWQVLQASHGAGMEWPILAYLSVARGFAALGDARMAHQAAEAGRAELQARAEKISDPEWRRSFLEGVPEHRALAAFSA